MKTSHYKLSFNRIAIAELNIQSMITVLGGSNNSVYDVNTDIDPTTSKGDTYLRTQTLLEQ